jgi:hypothetical protein
MNWKAWALIVFQEKECDEKVKLLTAAAAHWFSERRWEENDVSSCLSVLLFHAKQGESPIKTRLSFGEYVIPMIKWLNDWSRQKRLSYWMMVLWSRSTDRHRQWDTNMCLCHALHSSIIPRHDSWWTPPFEDRIFLVDTRKKRRHHLMHYSWHLPDSDSLATDFVSWKRDLWFILSLEWIMRMLIWGWEFHFSFECHSSAARRDRQ